MEFKSAKVVALYPRSIGKSMKAPKLSLMFTQAKINVCDVPVNAQLEFQDPATEAMEGIVSFNAELTLVILGIIGVVSWLLSSVINNFLELNISDNASKVFFHSSVLEVVWTTIPALILLSLAWPSFSLLYGLNDSNKPSLTLKILGHQWFWGYEISDFNSCSKIQHLKFTSYMLSIGAFEKTSFQGFFRNLETNKRVALPTNTSLRLLVTAVDVLHSWTIPSFGVKVDACPGRLNQVTLLIKRFGLFFGQCSEICGVNHGFMPIVVMAIGSTQYFRLIMHQAF